MEFVWPLKEHHAICKKWIKLEVSEISQIQKIKYMKSGQLNENGTHRLTQGVALWEVVPWWSRCGPVEGGSS